MNQIHNDLKELKNHGNLDYPVAVYSITSAVRMHPNLGWHWHDELEFVWVEKGSVEYRASDQSHLLQAGEGILVNQGVLHAAIIPEDEADCLFHSIVFHPSFLIAYGRTRLTSTYLHPVLSNTEVPCFALDPNNEMQAEILSFLQKTVACNNEQKYAYELYAKEYLLHIWLLLLERLQVDRWLELHHRDSRTTLDENRAKAILEFIEAHYTDDLTLDEIAREVHVSKSECCRCLKRTMQITPFEYLTKFRIYAAVGILTKEPQVSMAELAYRVGFNSSSYFNKQFRKYMACTPTEYRRSH